MGSNEEKGTPGDYARKRRELEELQARLKADWEHRRRRDEETAGEIGRWVVAHVVAQRKAAEIAQNRRVSLPASM